MTRRDSDRDRASQAEEPPAPSEAGAASDDGAASDQPGEQPEDSAVPAALDGGDDGGDDLVPVDEGAAAELPDERDPTADPGATRELETALARAAAGDESAWAWIVDAYSRRVFGLLYAQCGEAETAEELTQSTFCTVVAKIGAYTERGRFESWLFRIAVNRLRDEMRRRKRHAVPVEHEALAGMASGVDSGEDVSDEIRLLREAVGGLPDADQRVLHLRHAAGLGFKQIASVLGQPLGTVLARHHRALRKLRGELQPRLDGEGAGDDSEPKS